MDISRFESLGDNCEFGFVQRKLGAEDGSLFRWARIEPWQLYAVLEHNFVGIYKFENLVPLQPTMVTETYFGFGWHSKLYSAAVKGVMTFKEPEEARRRIHASEYRKQVYLVTKFLTRLRAGGMIYVIKSNKGIDPVCLTFIERELTRLARGAKFWLLELRATQDAALTGQCERVGPQRLLGHVARFGTYDTADDFDLEVYKTMLPKALGLAAFPTWAASQKKAAAELATIRATLPFPKKDFLGTEDVTTDLDWCKAAIFNSHHWSRQIENAFRLHAFGPGRDAARLSWSKIKRPGKWTVVTAIALAVEDSLPVTVRSKVSVNGKLVAEREDIVDSMSPVRVELSFTSTKRDSVDYEIEVTSAVPVDAGQKAVVDIEEIGLETT